MNNTVLFCFLIKLPLTIVLYKNLLIFNSFYVEKQ